MKLKEFLINEVNPNKIGICLGIIIFIFTLLSITYAYVEPTFDQNGVDTQSLANKDQKITITDDKSMMKNYLIPIKEEDIFKSLNKEKMCTDDKGHNVCSLYQFTIKNEWEAAQKMILSIYTEQNTYGNYYFMLFSGKKEKINENNLLVSSTHLKQDYIGEDLTIPGVEPLVQPNKTVTFTILFFIKEINASQTAVDKGKTFVGHINVNSSIEGYAEGDTFDNSNANPPDISNTGLVPIKYDETKSKWVVTSESDSDWYNYDNQKWANAASLKSTVSTTPGTELDIENDAYAMFVWIPRYSYTIGCTSSSSCYGYKVDTDKTSLSSTTPGAIDIKFVSSTTKEIYQNSETSGTVPTYTYSTTDTEDQRIAKREEAANWYTHPAFTFGDKELSGIWVGKFETSTAVGTRCYDSTTDNCSVGETEIRILPNVISQRDQKVSNQFKYAQYLTMNNIYGLTGDAHMMKNSEWGAVAYLSQSIYGKYGNPKYEGANKEIYINNSSSYYTGRSGGTPSTSSTSSSGTYNYNVSINGTGASTTGNIYGIYDMSGGANESVMGNYNDGTQQLTGSSGFSSTWFTEETNKKYFDKYTTTTPFTTKDKTTNGGALAETASWYGDRTDTFSTTENWIWLFRGGLYSASSNAGPFYGCARNGDSFSGVSFRVSFASTS